MLELENLQERWFIVFLHWFGYYKLYFTLFVRWFYFDYPKDMFIVFIGVLFHTVFLVKFWRYKNQYSSFPHNNSKRGNKHKEWLDAKYRQRIRPLLLADCPFGKHLLSVGEVLNSPYSTKMRTVKTGKGSKYFGF